MSENSVLVDYHKLTSPDGSDRNDRIASLVINKTQTANAFSGDILTALSDKLTEISQDESLRLLFFQSEGKHFSAGADLKWMQESAEKSHQENIDEAHKLTMMFRAIEKMPIPTIALVKGAAYGGAVGIAAACDYCFATEDARFCLSETRIGLLPAVILPYLQKKLPLGQLKRWTLSAQIISSSDALQNGLVQRVVANDEMEELLKIEVAHLLSASPEAQKRYKLLQKNLEVASPEQYSRLCEEAIADARASDSGKAGLAAFFAKSKPQWTAELAEGERIFRAF